MAQARAGADSRRSRSAVRPRACLAQGQPGGMPRWRPAWGRQAIVLAAALPTVSARRERTRAIELNLNISAADRVAVLQGRFAPWELRFRGRCNAPS
jgi:hypothetical protein